MSTTDRPEQLVAYLLNLCDPNFELPIEVIPGFTLRRPTERERAFISDVMHQSGNRYAGRWPAGPYEMRIAFSHGRGMVREPDASKWRYLVVEYSKAESPRLVPQDDPRRRRWRNFELAALLSDARLLWAYESLADPPKPSVLWSNRATIADAYDRYLDASLMREKAVPSLTSDQLRDIKLLFDELEGFSPDHELIVRACQQYAASWGLNVHSSFRVLALFAAVELLVTHRPSPNETGDGLTRQIKGKLPLLCRRFTAPYSPEQVFLDAGGRGWELLYDYRSAIAHGGNIDFKTPCPKKGTNKDGGFKQLKSAQEVFFFLDEFVRRLLRHAILEPQLCLDLKAC